MLTCGYASSAAYGGPSARLGPGLTFTSFRVLLVWGDSTEAERHGLGIRRLTRLLAPQSSEAPLFLHLTDASFWGFRKAVDQMSAVGGFDMLIFSFGSGFNLEDTSHEYLAKMKADVAYAQARGIEVGGYDLICLSRGDTPYSAISPATNQSEGSQRWI